MKIRTLIALLIIPLLFLTFSRIALMAGSFYDVPEDTVFYPYIQKLYDEHFIAGRTSGGKVTGTFDPDSSVNRAEMAKVTVITRLAEEVGISHQWQNKEGLAMEEELFDLLTPYLDCLHGACVGIGNRLFTDVSATPAKCAENISGCSPWFGRYVYYAVSKGFIQGYPQSDGKRAFKPTDEVLRIHALKMILVDDFSLPPAQDIRYQTLDRLATSRKSYTPKCLKGAEPWILANNPGTNNRINDDSRKLLSFALLADRLDFFGSTCQVFSERGAKTPKQRADFLQKPLARKEVPRYFALTLSYSPAVIPVNEDTTVNDAPENEKTLASFTYDTASELTHAQAAAEVIIQKAETLVKEGKADSLASAVKLVDEKEMEKEISKIPYPDTRPKEDEKPAVIITPKKKPETKKAEPPPAAAEPSLPASLITLKKSQKLCNESGCITVPPGSELEMLVVLNSGSGFVQNIVYNGQLYTVSCAELKSAECQATMAESFLEVSTDPYSALTEVFRKIQLRAVQIQKNMDDDFRRSGNAASTCKWGLAGKTPGMGDYVFVMGWCQQHPEAMKELKKMTAKPLIMPKKGTDYWYTVIPGWQTKDDGLWGGVFTEKRYDKAYLTDTLFPEQSGDKYKEFIVRVTGNAEDYDASDPSALANKKAMILNYRTDRWYKIYYINPADPLKSVKTGWVPVSGLILKDNSLFYVVNNQGNYEFWRNSEFKNGGYANGDQPVDKLLLHNSNGYGVLGTGYHAVHYYQERADGVYGDKFVIRVPEYLGTGTTGFAEAEQKSISVEMVNVEWYNPALKIGDYLNRVVKDGIFHKITFDNFQHYVIALDDMKLTKDFTSISGLDYDLVNYYFSETDGFFEVFNHEGVNNEGISLLETVRSDKKVFDRFYRYAPEDKAYILRQKSDKDFDAKKHIDALTLINSDSKNELAPLYGVLNKIPYGYNFYDSNKKSAPDLQRVISPRGTYPFEVYRLPDSPRNQPLNDGEDPDYYESYTPQQYANLNTFIRHMNNKYGITMKTFAWQTSGGAPQKYGFYYQEKNTDKIMNQASEFKGIISHRNGKNGGKMCPAPGFQIDRISVLKNQ